MAFKEVEKYQVGWKHDSKSGVIALSFTDKSWLQIYPLTYEDFTAMVDLLRNEKPIYYDKDQSLLDTIHEPVGEGET